MVTAAFEVLEALKRRRRQPYNIDKTDTRPEKGLVWDFYPDTGKRIPWHATLPRTEWLTHLPVEARHSPDVHFYKVAWMVLDALGLFILSLIFFFFIYPPVVRVMAIFYAVPFMIGGAAIGYFSGGILTPPPHWSCRRIWWPRAVEPDTGEVIPPHLEIRPIVHTMLRGEPPLVVPHTETNGAKPDTKENKHGKMELLGFPPIPEGMWYPKEPRATTLYEDLKMRDEKEDMKTPLDRNEIIKLGAVGLLCGGLVVGLIFLMAVTGD